MAVPYGRPKSDKVTANLYDENTIMAKMAAALHIACKEEKLALVFWSKLKRRERLRSWRRSILSAHPVKGGH